jgi:hypothetical protein
VKTTALPSHLSTMSPQGSCSVHTEVPIMFIIVPRLKI